MLRHAEPELAEVKHLLNETLHYVQCDDPDIHVIGSERRVSPEENEILQSCLLQDDETPNVISFSVNANYNNSQ